jgi:hypothetical protein
MTPEVGGCGKAGYAQRGVPQEEPPSHAIRRSGRRYVLDSPESKKRRTVVFLQFRFVITGDGTFINHLLTRMYRGRRNECNLARVKNW